jgi:Tol biopolymer transport system component
MPAKLRLHAGPVTFASLAVILSLVVALTPSLAPATFPGTNGRISFDRFVERTESVEIFTAKPDGTDVQKLTSMPHFTSVSSDWSPNGQRIAFDSADLEQGHNHIFQIYLMNANGGGVRQLTESPGRRGGQFTPGWSPDGHSLAIAAGWGHARSLQGIWIIPASGHVTQADAQRLTTRPAEFLRDFEPQFSPDGNSIAFTRFKDARTSAILRVGIDGTGLERLTPWHLNASHPDWSPDGQKITFDSGDFNGRTDGGGNIYVMRADGSGRKKLTNYQRLRKGDRFNLANNPVWSPNGTRIMFVHFLPNRSEFVAMKPNGSHKHVVLDGHHFQNRVDWGTHP